MNGIFAHSKLFILDRSIQTTSNQTIDGFQYVLWTADRAFVQQQSPSDVRNIDLHCSRDESRTSETNHDNQSIESTCSPEWIVPQSIEQQYRIIVRTSSCKTRLIRVSRRQRFFSRWNSIRTSISSQSFYLNHRRPWSMNTVKNRSTWALLVNVSSQHWASWRMRVNRQINHRWIR